MMTILFQIEQNILIMTITGTCTINGVEQARTQSAAMCKEADITHELIDICDAEIHFSTLEIFEFITSFADVFPRHTKHAVVFSPTTFDSEKSRFAETVANNHGIIMKMFTDLDEATRWLTNTESTTHQSLGRIRTRVVPGQRWE